MRWRERLGVVAMAAVLIAGPGLAGCSGGGSGADIDIQAADPPGTTAPAGQAVGPDAYQCLDAWPTGPELEGLADLPSPDEAAFEQAGTYGPLGDRADWAVLATGWWIDRRPLEGEGGVTGLVAATPDGYLVGPCVPRSLETGAPWTPGGPTAAPAFVPSLDQARCEAVGTVGGISVRWWDLPPGAAWELRVDGQELGSDLVPTGDAPLLDQLVAAFDERLASYGRPPAGSGDDASLGGTGADPVGPPPQGVRDDFAAMGGPLGVARTYEMAVTLGDTERLLACGTATIPAELPVPTCSLSLTGGIPRITLSDLGMTPAPDSLTVRRDGEPLTLGGLLGPTRTDLGAPPGPHRYQVEVRDPLGGRPAVTADCGSITVQEPPTGPDALRAAKEVFDTVMLGPYLYARAEQAGAPVDLVMQFTDTGFAFDPAHPADESLNPYTVHDRLISAIEAGSPVTFQLDPATGLPRTWTIDGVTRSYVCVNVDTAPPGLRPTACDDSHNRLGPAP